MSLAKQVEELESRYRELCGRHFELLATLRLPRNREILKTGNQEALELLWQVVDKEWTECRTRFPSSD